MAKSIYQNQNSSKEQYIHELYVNSILKNNRVHTVSEFYITSLESLKLQKNELVFVSELACFSENENLKKVRFLNQKNKLSIIQSNPYRKNRYLSNEVFKNFYVKNLVTIDYSLFTVKGFIITLEKDI